MRAQLLPLTIGLLAWVPACRNDAFQSCDDASGSCIADASAEPTLSPILGTTQVSDAATSATDPTPSPPLQTDSVETTSEHASAQGETDARTPEPAVNETLPGDASVSPSPLPAPDPTSTTETSATTEATAPAETSSEPAPMPSYPFGESLIVNGDFSDRGDYWDIESTSGGTFTSSYADDALCLTPIGRTQLIVGWPADASDSLDLPAGRYRFSYRVRGQNVSLWAKVGHAYEPYEVLFEAEWNGSRPGWEEVVHEFTIDGDPAAGVAFTVDLALGTICLDDVALELAELSDG